MTRHARTTSRASETVLETATLVLAAITALTVIARHEGRPPARRDAPAAALQRPAPVSGAVTVSTEDTGERAALLRDTLRDMLLHD